MFELGRSGYTTDSNLRDARIRDSRLRLEAPGRCRVGLCVHPQEVVGVQGAEVRTRTEGKGGASDGRVGRHATRSLPAARSIVYRNWPSGRRTMVRGEAQTPASLSLLSALFWFEALSRLEKDEGGTRFSKSGRT